MDSVKLEHLAKMVSEKTDISVKTIDVIKKEENTKEFYIVYTEGGEKYVLKPLVMSEGELKTYKEITGKNLPYFQTVPYIWEEKTVIWSMAKWVDGHLLDDNLWEADRLKYVENLDNAAKRIREIHDFSIMEPSVYVNENIIDRKLSVSFLDDSTKTKLKSYILKNIEKINSRKWSILHGDLHIENMLVTDRDILFIDMDDVFYGDPYRDLVYAANIHKSAYEDLRYFFFLQSYFDEKISEDFWPIVNCYSIIKAIDIMAQEIELTHDHCSVFDFQSFLDDHDDLNSDVPKWFIAAKERAKRIQVGED